MLKDTFYDLWSFGKCIRPACLMFPPKKSSNKMMSCVSLLTCHHANYSRGTAPGSTSRYVLTDFSCSDHTAQGKHSEDRYRIEPSRERFDRNFDPQPQREDMP
jgi:hypothetical protein